MADRSAIIVVRAVPSDRFKRWEARFMLSVVVDTYLRVGEGGKVDVEV